MVAAREGSHHGDASREGRCCLVFQHSPSRRREAELRREMFCFGRREGFGKHFGRHVFSRTVNELDLPFFDDPADEMVPDVDVFRSGMVLVVTSLASQNLGLTMTTHSKSI